jgi:hypothetical protein
MEEVDIQRLIKELAATWVDPWWVYEAIAIEQDRVRAEMAAAAVEPPRTPMGQLLRLRPQLRVVAAGSE